MKLSELSSYGKIPPQAIEHEEALLGAIMLLKEAFPEVQHSLFPSIFYKDSHQLIYSAILDLDKSNNPIDIMSVANQLKKNGTLDTAGGPFYLTTLTQRVGGGGSYPFSAAILKECWAKREIIRTSNLAIAEAYDDTSDVFDIVGRADNYLQTINDSLISGENTRDYSAIVDEAIQQIEVLNKNPGTLSGVPTGNAKLDVYTGGWQNTDLIIMAARPGMGKTTRALNFVIPPLSQGIPVACFSLEMSARQIIHKQLNESSEVLIAQMRTGQLNPVEMARLKASAEMLKSNKFFLDDTAAVTPNHIRNVCRRIKRLHGLGLIVIDYLQLMHPNESRRNSNAENDLSSITAAVKNIAKELDVPIILLSQLNRDVENRPDKRPTLSDLRGSGAIEQDADIVMGIYRGSYYKSSMYEDVPELVKIYEAMGLTDQEWAHASVIEVLKNRNGRLAKVVEMFRGDISRFFVNETVKNAPF